MAWRAVPRIQRQAQHLLCHIQARVNAGSFVAASSSGPAGSIRMEADGGQFDGPGPGDWPNARIAELMPAAWAAAQKKAENAQAQQAALG